jgi:hypothetical protein
LLVDRQLKHARELSGQKLRYENHRSISKFESVVVSLRVSDIDLPETRYSPGSQFRSKEKPATVLWWRVER